MNRALAATLVMLTYSFVSPAASAQTRLESNAEDIKCDWTDSKGHSGSEICHITSQGTAQGETSIAFRIGDRKHEYVASDSGWARLILGDQTLWEGKTIEFTSKNGITTLKISDGVTVRLHYK